jgi:hypothetical protein
LDPTVDGTGFSLATLIRWVNDAMRIMATSAPIIQDWHAVQSTQGMDLYELPAMTLSVEQLWYDLFPCVRQPELMTIWETKLTARSYAFGPHSIHAQPRIQVWPACDRTGATTTLSTTITSTATSIVVADASAFQAYGYIGIEDEIIAYRTVSSNTLTGILRGQAGSTASSHNSGATVTERNIMMKLSRLPTPVTGADDPIEIPVGLTPLIELYVLAKIREAEQESALALQLRNDFNRAMEALQAKAQLKGLRQGIQVQENGPGAWLYFNGRVFVP